MTNLSIRGLDETLARKLKEDAKRQSVSVNTLVLELIRSGLGEAANERFKEHHDLDELAGTWDATNETEFNEVTSEVEKIDKDLWR